jgi:hypothetical protein
MSEDDDVTVYETKHRESVQDSPRAEALRRIARIAEQARRLAAHTLPVGTESAFERSVSEDLQRAQDWLAAENVRSETQASIAAWADATFGEPKSNLCQAERAQKEMVELIGLLSSDDAHPKAGREVADVVIVLQRLASHLGIDLWREVERKMAINRAREWVLDGTGNGQHVPGSGSGE